MREIRLRNVRSLRDTGWIDIRPITILLGQNSSGKSTFLRSLPLISQSMKTRSNAPILWYGDFVDFGSVHEVQSTFAGDEPVSVGVNVGNTSLAFRHRYENRPYRIPGNGLSISLTLVEVDDRTVLRSFSIGVADDIIEINVDARGQATHTTVNGVDYTRLFAADRFAFSTNDFVPQIIVKSRKQDESGATFLRPLNSVDAVEKELSKLLSDRLHGRIINERIASIVERFRYRDRKDFLPSLSQFNIGLKSWDNFVKELSEEAGEILLEELRRLTLLLSLPDILLTLERRLSGHSSRLAYIGPSRATGERYYRMQELAIDQIDPQGKNLPMYLHSLTKSQMDSFSAWMEQAVGYAIKVERSSGHVQILLREVKSQKFFNLADMGYGFSQVLPILAQVWSRFDRRRLRVPGNWLIAIEQPELHLHPAYQAKLADIFVSSVKAADSGGMTPIAPVKLVIETHSESIINRLGELIAENAISAEDVAIYVFEKELEQEASSIRAVTYDSEGVLLNWPIGFFSSVL